MAYFAKIENNIVTEVIANASAPLTIFGGYHIYTFNDSGTIKWGA